MSIVTYVSLPTLRQLLFVRFASFRPTDFLGFHLFQLSLLSFITAAPPTPWLSSCRFCQVALLCYFVVFLSFLPSFLPTSLISTSALHCIQLFRNFRVYKVNIEQMRHDNFKVNTSVRYRSYIELFANFENSRLFDIGQLFWCFFLLVLLVQLLSSSPCHSFTTLRSSFSSSIQTTPCLSPLIAFALCLSLLFSLLNRFVLESNRLFTSGILTKLHLSDDLATFIFARITYLS